MIQVGGGPGPCAAVPLRVHAHRVVVLQVLGGYRALPHVLIRLPPSKSVIRPHRPDMDLCDQLLPVPCSRSQYRAGSTGDAIGRQGRRPGSKS
eukprot:3037522-Rhodomonas_salina.3